MLRFIASESVMPGMAVNDNLKGARQVIIAWRAPEPFTGQGRSEYNHCSCVPTRNGDVFCDVGVDGAGAAGGEQGAAAVASDGDRARGGQNRPCCVGIDGDGRGE